MLPPTFLFDQSKNLRLLHERGITFEQVIALIEAGEVIDVLENPNQDTYPGQWIYVVNVDGYCYLVPFVQKEGILFLKTIIPSRKATRNYLKGGS